MHQIVEYVWNNGGICSKGSCQNNVKVIGVSGPHQNMFGGEGMQLPLKRVIRATQ